MINTKQRNFFVSNSSSSSFICAFSGEIREGWDWDDPIDAKMYECEVCNSSFLIKELHKHGIYPTVDKCGYIRKGCPICNGWKVVRLILKPDETFKIIKKE